MEEQEQVGEPHGSAEVIEDVAQAVAYLGEGAFREQQEEQEELNKKSKKSKRGEGRKEPEDPEEQGGKVS